MSTHLDRSVSSAPLVDFARRDVSHNPKPRLQDLQITAMKFSSWLRDYIPPTITYENYFSWVLLLPVDSAIFPAVLEMPEYLNVQRVDAMKDILKRGVVVKDREKYNDRTCVEVQRLLGPKSDFAPTDDLACVRYLLSSDLVVFKPDDLARAPVPEVVRECCIATAVALNDDRAVRDWVADLVRKIMGTENLSSCKIDKTVATEYLKVIDTLVDLDLAGDDDLITSAKRFLSDLVSESPYEFSKGLIRGIYYSDFSKPTHWQIKALKSTLAGNDTVMILNAGSGKTVAFVIAALYKIDPKIDKCQALFVCPRREVAIETVDRIASKLAKFTDIQCDYHITRLRPNPRKLKEPCHFVASTPGGVLYLAKTKNMDYSRVKIVVLDECDEIFARGFGDSITELMALLPESLQVVVSSPTRSKEVYDFIRDYMSSPTEVVRRS